VPSGTAEVELVPHVPDAGVLPGNGIPIIIPPPSYVAVVPAVPGLEPASVGHATPRPVIPGDTAGTGLRPADGSSVAPMGSPVGATGESAVMPSGEVVPIPETVSFTCASAGSQPNITVRIEAISTARVLA
jgi:hypothetical protein